MNHTAGYKWFARHELSLSWRDLYAMLSGNRAGRGNRILLFIGIVAAGLHLLAYSVLNPIVGSGIEPDLKTLAMVSGFLLLPVSLMASQAMESITRAFYTRSDLELILASPAPATKLFAVRMMAIALSTSSLTLMVSAPVLNVLAILDGPGWLFGYPVIISFGLLATSFAILLTMGLFALIGPAKTRLVAQIVAAIVGAGFVIGIQLVAIASIGSMSRMEFLTSEPLLSRLPSADSALFMPAMASMGDIHASAIVLAVGVLTFISTIALTAERYGQVVLKAASIDMASHNGSLNKVSFRSFNAASVLRRKEWKLLLRDKWLLSQTLMQLLYLIPPAFMLWQGFGQNNSVEFIVVPVIVMAAGQLSGGLAWLAISGEDAPELVATAPVTLAQVTRAKVEAVLLAVGFIVAPILLLLALLSPLSSLIAAITIMASVSSATLIQLWFKAQAKRSNFRRRQTSSKMATISEAFSSILWAGAAGIWIAGSWLAVAPVLLIAAILGVTWWISPMRQERLGHKGA